MSRVEPLRAWLSVAFGGIVGIVCLAAGFQAAAYQARVDAPSPNYISGYFVQVGNARGIAWDPAAPTDATVVPNPPEDPCLNGLLQPACATSLAAGAPKTAQDSIDIAMGTEDKTATWGTPVAFTSAPVPRDLFLNGSRLLVVRSFTHLNGEAPFEVRVFANGQLLAGGSDTCPSTGTNACMEPADSPEWQGQQFQLQVEKAKVPAGAILVVYLRAMSPEPMAFGYEGDHRTVIRFPVFAPEEVALRVTPSAGSTGRDAGLGGASVVLVGILLGARGRKVPRLVLCLATQLVLSGCTSGESQGGLGENEGGSLQIQGTGAQSGDKVNATLLGFVHDEQGLAVVGSVVSLVDLVRSRTTDGFGGFSFIGVPPGQHTLRVEKTGFKVFLEQIHLTAGAEIRVDIGLVRTGTFDLGALAHVHDYWTSDRMVVMDEDLPIGDCFTGDDASGALKTVAYSFECGRDGVEFSLPNDGTGKHLVNPGTAEVVVTFGWDAAEVSPDLEFVGLFLRALNDPNPENASFLLPRRAGQAFRIATTWEMADVGHQQYSQWLFGIWMPENQTESRDQTLAPVQKDAWGPIHVKVEIVKGIVPHERPHPDPWSGQSTVQAFDADLKAPSPCSTVVSAVASCAPITVNLSAVPKGLVPADTVWLELQLEVSRPGNPPYEWLLGYKGATSAQRGCRANEALPDYIAAKDAITNGNLRTWRIALDPRLPDAYYARATSWCFWVQVDDGQAYFLDYCLQAAYCSRAEGRTGTVLDYNRNQVFLHFSAIAHRDPFPSP